MTRERYRSEAAEQYRPMYKTARWRALREVVLERDRFKCQHRGCHVFVVKGKTSPRGAVVHHVKAHKGDPVLFYDPDNCVTVCKRCHDADLQSEEVRGFSTAVGEDGWPVDGRHPFNVEPEPD